MPAVQRSVRVVVPVWCRSCLREHSVSAPTPFDPASLDTVPCPKCKRPGRLILASRSHMPKRPIPSRPEQQPA